MFLISGSNLMKLHYMTEIGHTDTAILLWVKLYLKTQYAYQNLNLYDCFSWGVIKIKCICNPFKGYFSFVNI